MRNFIFAWLVTTILLISCGESRLIITETEAYWTKDSSYLVSFSPDSFKGDSAPSVVRRVDPKYPKEALSAGTGKVWVKMLVDEEGIVRRAMVMESTNQVLNKPSLRAAMSWRFKPGSFKGKPIPAWIAIPFGYSLRQPQ